MTDVVIRPERPEDAAAARAVHIDAFPVPDGEVQSVESVLVDWLREDGDVLWPLTLVAERDGQIVGSVVCSRGTIDERDSVGLGPIGVCAAYQGKGIGTRLMEAVIEAAQESGEREIVLLGDPGFYGRFGFVPATTVGVVSPAPWPDAYFQVKPLADFDPATDGGSFRYAGAFDRLNGPAGEGEDGH